MPYQPNIKLSGSVVRAYQNCCIYIWKRGEETLYVGCSQGGLARAISNNHHVIGKRDQIQDDDTFELIWCVPEHQGSLEAQLIHELRPRYNKTGRPWPPPLPTNLDELHRKVYGKL